MRIRVMIAAALCAAAAMAMSWAPDRLNPVIDLLERRQPVFGVYAPANPRARPGETAPAVPAPTKTPAQLAQDALAYAGADYVFDGSMERNFERGYTGFAEFARGMFAGGLLHRTPVRRIAQPLFVKTPEIAPDPAKARERISQQLNLGVSGIVFVDVKSADEVRQGLAMMRFASKGGTRPDSIGDAASLWGMSDKEYRQRADLWPLNPNGELVNFTIVESREGLAKVREIAAVKGIGVLFPGAGTLRGVFSTTDSAGRRVLDQTGWEAAIQQVLAACKEFNVPCGYPAGEADIEMRMKQGFSVFVIGWGDAGFRAVDIGRRVAGRAPGDLKTMARERLAQLDGKLAVPGLLAPVEVRRDRWGVPHIYANSQHDLFFAQGFVAAQDRLFQMEMWRRIGQGRLAEVLGPTFVPRDIFARLLKYRGDMAAEWSSYAPDTKEITTAFVDGVNAYIAQVRDKPPIEFTLLGFQPQPWTADVPLQRMAALAMTGNVDSEVLRARLIAAIGVEKAQALMSTIPHRDLDPAPGLSLERINEEALGAYSAAVGGITYPRVVGSNNWVVSGKLTKTGKPILANDPHRFLDSPSLRWLSHLVAPGWNVIGAGEPAVPGVAAGHNERIGFGFTIVGMDQQDLYIETLGGCPTGVAAGSSTRCYLNGGTWKPVRQITDTILVKGEAPRVATLEFTEHGPIISEQSALDDNRSRGFALRFVGSEPGTAGYLAQLSVDRAHDWKTFLDAAARWKLPTENLIYADVDGNIGWMASGLMPKRSWSGLLPVPGTGGFEWNGFRSASELPKSFNPPSGFIVTANHDIRPAGYDVPLNYEFATPFRADRVTQVLGEARSGRRFDVADFKRLQHDELSLQARQLVPVLLSVAKRTGKSSRWEYQHLAGWNYVMRSNDVAPLLYETWKRSFSMLATRWLVGTDKAPLLGEFSWLDEWPRPLDALAQLPLTARDPLMMAAMDTALAKIRTRLGPDRDRWRWGGFHTASFFHRVASVFDLAPVERGGDGSTVNSTSGPDYKQMYGASFREILDAGNWDRSVATSVPGQSGQPESEYYGNLLPNWARGEYFPLVFSRPAVERETQHVLWLTPPTPATRQ